MGVAGSGGFADGPDAGEVDWHFRVRGWVNRLAVDGISTGTMSCVNGAMRKAS